MNATSSSLPQATPAGASGHPAADDETTVDATRRIPAHRAGRHV